MLKGAFIITAIFLGFPFGPMESQIKWNTMLRSLTLFQQNWRKSVLLSSLYFLPMCYPHADRPAYWTISPSGKLVNPGALSYRRIPLLTTSCLLLPIYLTAYDFFLLFVNLLISELCPHQQQQSSYYVKGIAARTQNATWGSQQSQSLYKASTECIQLRNCRPRKVEQLPLKSHSQVMQAGFKPRSAWP